MPDGFSALFWGVVTFSLLIVIHEGGHFLAARLFGVKVHEFMIGLPGPSLRFYGKKTTYGITAIPLGGYVRIAGMEPGPEDPLLGPVLGYVTRVGNSDASGVAAALSVDAEQADMLLQILADWDALVPGDSGRFSSRFAPERADDEVGLLDEARSVTYRRLSTWQRVVMLSAGIVLNLMTAVLVFTVVLAGWGYLEPTTVVAEVTPDSAAAAAGILPGDRILAVSGKEIAAWPEVTGEIADHRPGDTVEIDVSRDGSKHTIEADLGEREETGQAFLGVSPEFENVKFAPLAALKESFSYIGLTFQAIAGFFNPSTFQASVKGSSSIIGASYIAAEAAKSSPIDYAAIVALLSLSLGAINILPIPPLDGGKIAVEIIERVFRKQIPRNVSLGLSVAGTTLLFVLIAYLMYSDVFKFILRG